MGHELYSSVNGRVYDMKKSDLFVFAVLVLALPFIIRAVNKEGAKCQVKS